MKDYTKYGKILSVDVDKSSRCNKIIINCENKSINFTYSNQCCEKNWFQFENIESIIGKTIVKIDFYTDSDSDQLITLKFSNHTKYKFYLMTSSNGYYRGTIYVDTTASYDLESESESDSDLDSNSDSD